MSDSNESQLDTSLSSESADNSVYSSSRSSKRGKIYKQFYRKAWEEVPEFKDWLTSIPNERSLAYCKICQRTLHAHRLSLTKHTVSLKHTRLAQRKAANELHEEEMESACVPSNIMELKNTQILTGMQSGHDYALTNNEVVIHDIDQSTSGPSLVGTTQVGQLSQYKTSAMVQTDNSAINYSAVMSHQKKQISEKLPITTHVLDISKGVPAAGLAVSLYQLIDGRWTIVKDGHTNGDGRCNTLTSAGSIRPGRYKLHFDTDRYFVMHHQATFFPFVEVVFDVCSSDERNHIPLLLSPYGYQTYRGS